MDSLHELHCEEGNYDIPDRSEEIWKSSYYEASVYIKEGEDNVKFTVHPRNSSSQAAYSIIHTTWFHLLNLFASLGLLLLTVFEPPSFPALQINVSVHGVLEIAGLLVICTELVLRLKWLGFRTFITHVRTMLKVILLAIMFAEAVTVIIRQSSHIRVTRALRPLFLLDSFYCRGVRRFIRQLLQSLSAIIHILALLFFILITFSTLGFFLFSSNPKDTYFQTFADSFISLFILMTTANYPDVMMPSYKESKWSSIFFIIYISLEVFIFMNLFLAVMYSAFLKNEKEKFRKLFLHKRNACGLAFQLLVSDKDPDSITFSHFNGFMKHYKPKMCIKETYLVFKALNTSESGKLSLDEFMNVYDYSKFTWKSERSLTVVSSFSCYQKTVIGIRRLVSNKWFDYSIYIVIFANFVWIVYDTIRISILKSASMDSYFDWMAEEAKFNGISLVFVFIYVVEAAMKMIGFGVKQYFLSGWNVFDFSVTATSLAAELLQLISHNFYVIIIFRPLRVLRLFKLRRSSRDIFGSLFILFPRILSLGIVMLLFYYFFAIIGMEIFAPYTYKLMNCCINTSVQQYYMCENNTNLDGYYYLNTFENLLVSGVTLFELTVVNNWWIIMEGFANVVSPWTRLYFMVFYLINMVVMTVVVAFVLEAYLFRNQCAEEIEENGFSKISICLTREELDNLSSHQIVIPNECSLSSDVVHYEGCRKLKKSDFSLKMYSSDVSKWLS